MRSFTGTTGAKVSYANGFNVIKGGGLQKMRIVQKVSNSGYEAINQRKMKKQYVEEVFQNRTIQNIKLIKSGPDAERPLPDNIRKKTFRICIIIP